MHQGSMFMVHLTTASLQDNAALGMMERAADAWEHNQFKDVIVKAANVEMYVTFFPNHLGNL